MTEKTDGALTTAADERRPPVRVKLERINANYSKTYPPDGDVKLWGDRLKRALGTGSSDFVDASLFQFQKAAQLPCGGISAMAVNAVLAMIEVAAPKNEVELKPFFENPRLPILEPDPMRGGLTDLRKIATIANTWGMTIAPHLFPELNVQLLASISNGLWIEDMGLSDDLWIDPVPVVNGMITAPERPGHGLAFKPEILRDCAVKD